jgi:superfamily II DNA/RNA helicase
VVHIDPPAEHKAYLHRSGRTARAGNSGDVVTVVLPEQRRDTQVLLRRAGISVTPQEVTADSAAVQAVAGERAPHRAPAPKTTAPKTNAPKAHAQSRPSQARRSRSARRRPQRTSGTQRTS